MFTYSGWIKKNVRDFYFSSGDMFIRAFPLNLSLVSVGGSYLVLVTAMDIVTSITHHHKIYSTMLCANPKTVPACIPALVQFRFVFNNDMCRSSF